MKNLKFLLFAVAMLLTVCVQAENKPETVANVTPEPVVAKVSAEPADVQQVPCSIIFWNQPCDGTGSIQINVPNEQACRDLAAAIGNLLSLIGC